MEARSDAWLADLFVQPDVTGGSCTVSATLSGKAGASDGARLEVFETSGKRVAEATLNLDPDPALAAGPPVSVKGAMPGARVRARSSPALVRCVTTTPDWTCVMYPRHASP